MLQKIVQVDTNIWDEIYLWCEAKPELNADVVTAVVLRPPRLIWSEGG